MVDETRYVELISQEKLPSFGTGYQIAFDKNIDTTGFSEIRLWVHIFVDNYKTQPIDTTKAKLTVRFLHQFKGGSFDYTEGVITTKVTSYIGGYIARPIIGNMVRVLCHPENMPPGPYTLNVTYYLVR